MWIIFVQKFIYTKKQTILWAKLVKYFAKTKLFQILIEVKNKASGLFYACHLRVLKLPSLNIYGFFTEKAIR